MKLFSHHPLQKKKIFFTFPDFPEYSLVAIPARTIPFITSFNITPLLCFPSLKLLKEDHCLEMNISF